jgi:hypothetical protein
LLGDCISRFLHETPELTPVDVFRLQRMDKAPWDTSAVTTPVLGEETKTSLLSHVIDVDCPKADRTLGVYMERIMTSGSLTSVPPVAVGIFKKYIKDGLVEALPWSELMCVAARDEVLDYAVTAFALDKDYVYGWVGDVAPPRLLLNRFISTVMGNAEHEVPMHNHLDIAHMVAELGNIAAWGCVERAMTKESANQLKTDIEVLMGDASACPATRSQTVSRIRAAARRYQISKKNYTDVEAMQASSGGGVTSTEKFKTAVQRLVCPGNVKKGTGGHLLAHRLIGAAASAMVRLLSVHGTIGVEQLNWRDYDSASYAGRKSYEILRAIHISKYIMYMQTFFARMKSELRPEGSRREYDRKLFVAMESLESAMYAHTKGVWRLSRMFVAIWSHADRSLRVGLRLVLTCLPMQRRSSRPLTHFKPVASSCITKELGKQGLSRRQTRYLRISKRMRRTHMSSLTEPSPTSTGGTALAKRHLSWHGSSRKSRRAQQARLLPTSGSC